MRERRQREEKGNGKETKENRKKLCYDFRIDYNANYQLSVRKIGRASIHATIHQASISYLT